MPLKWLVSSRLDSANGQTIRRRFLKSIGLMFRAGGIYGHSRKRVSMKEQDYEQLTLFQEDSHASHSVKPGSDEARKMTATSGLKCSELYEKSGPLGCLVRMCLESSIWHSTRCYLTWKRKVTKSNASIFQLAVSMPRTDDTESLFWPTPSTGAALCGGTGNFKTLQRMAEKGLITEEERRQLSQGNGGKTNPGLLEWLMGYEQQFTKLIPTPTATDYKGGCASRFWTSTHTHTHTHGRGYDGLLRSFLELTPLGKIGQMNPEYLEWMLGLPRGWTELDASETQ